MPLRNDWVEALHARLIAVYGARFMSSYGEMPAELVRASWAEILDGMGSGDIAHALKHLDPDWPPNALQFRRLAQGRPRYTQAALPAPRASQAHVQAMLDRMQAVTARPRLNPKAWAHALKAREERGERLTPAQAEMWRAAMPYAAMPDTSTALTDTASIGAGYSTTLSQTLHKTLQSPEEGQLPKSVPTSGGGGGDESAGRAREKSVGAPSPVSPPISK